jgi:YidC/Oxa1 family membrane protein insertase
LNGEVPSNARELVITLSRGLRSEEANVEDDRRYLAFALKPIRDDARSVDFSKLDSAEHRQENGPFTWVASKNKYFLVSLLTVAGDGSPFSRVHLVGAPRTGGPATTADAHVVMPVENGRFSFEIYAGPQEWRRLRALGRDMEHANPYGGFMKGVVQPFATIVMRALLWMHDKLRLSYGWVLVIFGIAVRIILWPLNHRAMRSSLKMQAIQPEMAAIQKKYRTNPQKQQEEMVRIYREHGMSPFSMFSGCLPMLIPMPVLFALFFVFQNTIEFRGVSFLWLADISLKDPFYILPLIMGASMYLLSWIGMRNAPPNPQAKMMSYMFPVIMTVALLNMAAGLNLYYAVQNIAALPQQWLIARERARKAASPTRR